MKHVFALLATIVFAFHVTESARILGVFPVPGISHNILSSKLMRALVGAGHDVTMVSAYPMKDVPKNGTLNDIILEGFAEKMHSSMSGSNNMFALHEQNFLQMMAKMNYMFVEFSNNTLRYPKMQELIKSNQKFDAVIIEQFNNDALKVLAHIFDCPLIILSSMGPNSWVNSLVGNEAPISYVAHLLKGDFTNDLSLYNRAQNLLFYFLDYLLRIYYLLPSQEAIIRELFPDAPPLIDLYTNVSIVLLNSHTSLYPALPLVPNMIEIGGYFIDPPKKLPADLQSVMDKATEGIVYFSMGSNLKSRDIPEEKKNAIINVLGRLNMQVLWKFEQDLPNKPDNVIIRDWFPQQDVLAHPNVKLFITHGGLLSTTETVYHGVPILAVPVFGDQNANADRAVYNGYGLKLNFEDLSEEKLESLIKELLTNSKYRENVLRRSKIFHDRPEPPVKTALYWIDYVIRHKGAPHLRVAGLKLPWYKYYMVDVLVVIILAVVIVVKVLKLVFRKVYSLMCKKSNKVTAKKQKTN